MTDALDLLKSVGIVVSLVLNCYTGIKIFFSGHSNKIEQLENRLKELEDRQARQDIIIAVVEERISTIINLLEKIEKKLDNLK